MIETNAAKRTEAVFRDQSNESSAIDDGRETKKPRTMKEEPANHNGEASNTAALSIQSLESRMDRIEASLRKNHDETMGSFLACLARIQELEQRAREREERQVARSERIESLLEQVLEQQQHRSSNESVAGDTSDGSSSDGASDTEEEEDDDNNEEDEPSSRRNKRKAPETTESSSKRWDRKERKIVAMGLALYGRDAAEIRRHLKGRNYSTIYSYIYRHREILEKESQEYRADTEEEKAELLQKILRFRKEDDTEQWNGRKTARERKDTSPPSTTPATGKQELFRAFRRCRWEHTHIDEESSDRAENGFARPKRWTATERKLVAIGLALYGSDYQSIANLLEDRNINMIKMFLHRNREALHRESADYLASATEGKEELRRAVESLQREESDTGNQPPDDPESDDEDEDERESSSNRLDKHSDDVVSSDDESNEDDAADNLVF